MSGTNKDEFVVQLRPLVSILKGLDLRDEITVETLRAAAPADGDLIRPIRDTAMAAVESDWLLPKENGGVRFGRIAKDLDGFSVDVVLMSGPGPKHRHPNGEIDLCFARAGEPKFDGHPEGWVIYGPDTTHVPTVSDGEMLILYFLPDGAIDFVDAG